jgi:DNA processing protein
LKVLPGQNKSLDSWAIFYFLLFSAFSFDIFFLFAIFISMEKEGIIKREETNYPSKLKKIDTPPSFLRYKGSFDEQIFKNTLAVVGSRRMTSYGKRATEKLVGEIAEEGITIISGFMYGVDATAHKAALNAGGKTIAVLPCGINIVHPSYQKKLYNEITEKGLILSEYEDDFPPERWTYPQRNRIVVGLADAVLVVEAMEKSGSLISSSLAKKYNRKLFAVPGPIFNATSKGTNMLIREGATLVTSTADILSFFDKSRKNRKREKIKELSSVEEKIVRFLEMEPSEIDEIVTRMKLPVAMVSTTLSMLELKGFLKKEGRKYYVL